MTDRQNMQRNANGSFPHHSFPGGYPLTYVTGDGLTICPTCANIPGCDDTVTAQTVIWEGAPWSCDDCSAMQDTAYGEPDVPA